MLGEKLSTMREEPSEGLFDRIEATLAGLEAAPVATPAQPKRVALWSRQWVRLTTAVAAAVALFVGVVVVSNQSVPEELVAVVATEQVEQTNPELTSQTIETIESNTQSVEQVLATATPKRLKTTTTALYNEKAEEMQTLNEATPATTIEQTTESVAQKNNNNSSANQKATTKRAQKRAQRKSNAEIEEYWRGVMGLQQEEKSFGFGRPTEVKLYANNLGFNQGHLEVNNLASNTLLMSESTPEGAMVSPVANSTVMKAQKKNVSQLKHYMPVSVGLNASFSLNNLLSLETGVNYTNLYSSSDNTGNISTYHYTQNLHYIGVPLAASIHFVNFGQWGLYAKAGGSIEFCVAASKRQYIDNAINLVEDIDTSGVQIGLNAAAGVNYALWNNLGLFAEAGVAYWTATKPQPANYRTEHPLGFSLMAGVRIAFR